MHACRYIEKHGTRGSGGRLYVLQVSLISQTQNADLYRKVYVTLHAMSLRAIVEEAVHQHV